MYNKRKCKNGVNSAGCFFIAVGAGVFLACAIPRYVLIMLLGLGLIGVGICLIKK